MLDLALALLAGLATAASPCILPVLPILLGASVGQRDLWRPLSIVAGFVAVFSLATLVFSVAARSFGLSQDILRDAAAIMLVVFGVFMLWPALFDRLTARLTPLLPAGQGRERPGKLGGFLFGASLGLLWTPCAGPILATILALVASAETLTRGGLLLVVYAIGAGAPMLVIAYGGQMATSQVRQIARHAERLRQVFGVIVILTAGLIYFDYDALIIAWISVAVSP